jgi:serine/threonine protein kinase
VADSGGMHAMPVEAPAAGPNATAVTDALLLAAWGRGATSVWIEPGSDGVVLERGRVELGRCALPGGLTDAVVARLGLLCGLDLMGRGPQTGRCAARVGEQRFDLVVTLRSGSARLGAEVRILGDVERRGPRQVRVVDDRLEVGTVIGPYRILEEIGQGGMGVVHRVEHTMLERQFALKVLRGELLAADPTSAERFVREARAAARVRDPGIVDVTDFGELPDGRPYLVMELLEGTSLGDHLDGRGPLGADEALDLIRRIVRALGAAHAHGVVHRDLTPSNVFVDGPDCDLKITLVDFGAARMLDQDAGNDRSDFVFGTPCYISPEQAQGYPGDPRSDIYALGIILYEMLSGEVPFDGDDVRTVVRKHVFEAVPPLRSPFGPLPEGLSPLVQRCLRKDPGQRFQSTRELLDELARIKESWNRKGWRRWLPA